MGATVGPEPTHLLHQPTGPMEITGVLPYEIDSSSGPLPQFLRIAIRSAQPFQSSGRA